MHIAVLGGGIQGVCVALALAERGARVTLFERERGLLQRTSVVGEAKIHLGYVYAADPTPATVRRLTRGALAFSGLVSHWLECEPESIGVSSPFKYIVHRDSAMPVSAVEQHFAKVREEMVALDQGRGLYFGRDLSIGARRLTGEEKAALYGEAALAAYDTPEIAVNMTELVPRLLAKLQSEPAIEIRCGFEVHAALDARGGIEVHGSDGRAGLFDQVVNALWDGRFAVDAARGIAPPRQWIHRYKYGARFRLPDGATPPPSTSMVHGPFGDSVFYNDGVVYLSWYPVCMVATSFDMEPAWPTLEKADADRIISETFRIIGEIVPAISRIDPATLPDLALKAGTIVAWGKTDIDDRASGLHRRDEIGVGSYGAYHSIETGKLTMAPYFAEECAERIMGR